MEKNKTITLSMNITEFEMPPMRDVIVIGVAAPIGPEAARKMVEALSPEQYEVLIVEHEKVEALVVRKPILQLIDKSKLVSEILEEVSKIMTPKIVLRISLNVSLNITKTFNE